MEESGHDSEGRGSPNAVVVAIPLYDRFTALDAIGPYELLHVVPGVTVLFLGQETGQLFVADNGMLKLPATAAFTDVPHPDILVVPGGPGCFVAAKDPALISWINQGKIITSAGVSSGIDMALHLIAELKGEETAKMIQLFVEYDPQPPFDTGAVSKAGEELLAKTIELVESFITDLPPSLGV